MSFPLFLSKQIQERRNKMVKMKENDMKFITETLPQDLVKRVTEAETVNDVLDVLNDWLDFYPDCWEANGEDYNALGIATQRVYDSIYLNAEEY